MDSIIINNITEKDVERQLIRILIDNKIYFPLSDDGNSCSYDIKIKEGSETYDARYRYYRTKSGRLYLSTEVYMDRLRIAPGDILKVTILEEYKLYEIKKL